MLTESNQAAIIEEVKIFVDEHIRPFAATFEINEALPRELIRNMAARGYLAAPLPAAYGGLDLDPLNYGLLTEEVGKGCCSVRGLITVHTSLVGLTLLKWGSREQKEYWLPLMSAGQKIAAFALSEPEVGSDAGNIQTTYRKQGNNYIINGVKKWISFGDIADLVLVIATNGDTSSAFLVERGFKGFSSTPIKGMMAAKASHIATLTFDNVEVPVENMIGPEGTGFAYIANTALDHGRYSIAWAGVAIAQEAIDAMVSYARKRKQFGKKLYNFQLIQGMIGDAVTKTHAARALCLRAGELRHANHEDSTIETNIAKYFASRAAMDITVDAVQLHGANGFTNAYPVERLFREAKVLEIIEGSSQMQQEIIAGFALNRYYKHPSIAR